jgi:transcriptional regulator with XRE-family HTH domain
MTILELPDIIERERINRGISVKELCKHAGISKATYYHWCEKLGSPKISMLSCVMDVLGMGIEVKGCKNR